MATAETVLQLSNRAAASQGSQVAAAEAAAEAAAAAAEAAAAEAEAAAEAAAAAPRPMPDSVNGLLLQRGLARVPLADATSTNSAVCAAVRPLLAQQEGARTGRLGVWRFGDCESDEEEASPRVSAWGRR